MDDHDNTTLRAQVDSGKVRKELVKAIDAVLSAMQDDNEQPQCSAAETQGTFGARSKPSTRGISG